MAGTRSPTGAGSGSPGSGGGRRTGARGLRLLAAVFVGLCGLLAVAAGLAYLLWPRPVERPAVVITSPRSGEQVEVGREVIVHSATGDEAKVTRFELWVDGQLVVARSSGGPGDVSPLPLVARWQPSAAHTSTLTVRVFGAEGGRAHASINLEAVELADRDGDGVADDADACADERGSATARGCPDADGDGIPDGEDACPHVYGLPAGAGCPVPGEGDRDGDAVPDKVDAHPDEPGPPWAAGGPDGDADGVADTEDACPGELGWPHRAGCPTPGDLDADGVPDAEDASPERPGLAVFAGSPDRDGDGIPDALDADPAEPGPAGTGGAADADGDGVPDVAEICPWDPGPAENGGCPDTGAGDRDGDGVADDVDLAPDEPGLPVHGGCPPPGEAADADGNGIPDDQEPAEPHLMELAPMALSWPNYAAMRVRAREWTFVEFEALEFEVSGDYDEVHCYVGLAGGDVERYGPFEPLGERQWDIADLLGGENSRVFWVHEDEPLEMLVECGAQSFYRGRYGFEWGIHHDLGSFTRSHFPSEWDGHVITAGSEGGAEGHSFQAKYRLCAGSCETAAFPPPILSLLHGMGDVQLIWLWDGDRESIDGFRVYINDNHVFDLPPVGFYSSVRQYRPPCEERYEFHLTAFRGDRESPPSNTGYFSGGPCTVPRERGIRVDVVRWWQEIPDERAAEIEIDPVSGFLYLYWLDQNGNVCHGDPGVSGQPGPMMLIPSRRAEVGRMAGDSESITADELLRLQSDTFPLMRTTVFEAPEDSTGAEPTVRSLYDGQGSHLVQFRPAVWRVRADGDLFQDLASTRLSLPVEGFLSEDDVSPAFLLPIYHGAYGLCYAEDEEGLYLSVPEPSLPAWFSDGERQHPTMCRYRLVLSASALAQACLEGRLEGSFRDGRFTIVP